MDAAELYAQREQKDAFFKSHPQSPLTPHQQQLFNGLSYYDYCPELDLMVEVKPFDGEKDIQIQTTTGEWRAYRQYGEFTFEVDGEQARLTIYETPGGFFLPVVDANAGKETYPAGRYLEPEQVGDNTFHVDFNRLYNPFCAYSDEWSCPITPAENRLRVAIRAGEKLPAGEWVEK